MFTRARKVRRIKRFITQAYRDIDGFALAKRALSTTIWDEPQFTYGEICFHSFLYVLDHLPLTQASIFCDIGSGTGKNVLIAALYTAIKKSIGIECVDLLHQASREANATLNTSARCLSDQSHTAIEWRHEDFLDFDFTTANCFFVNATAFIPPFWQKLNAKLQTMKKGSLLCIVSRPLDTDDFELLHSRLLLMTWGYANVFFYRKSRDCCAIGK